jgi:hypothetical protein
MATLEDTIISPSQVKPVWGRGVWLILCAQGPQRGRQLTLCEIQDTQTQFAWFFFFVAKRYIEPFNIN